MFVVISSLLVLMMAVADCGAYVEMTPVLQMLNIPWEGSCPATPRLSLHPELQGLGWAGRCPTVYRILELPPSSEPQAILEGFCDPSCHNTECSPLGNFRCHNHTVEVAVSTLRLTERGEIVRAVRTEDVPVGCVCRSRKHTRLAGHTPLTVE